MKKTLLAITLAAVAIPTAPAMADRPYWQEASNHKKNHRIYDSRGRYIEPRRLSRNDRAWRGNDGRYYCKRDNGTTGLIVGAGVGALAGHEIAGRGDRTLGAIIGGVAGGVLGREIDKGDVKCR